VTPALAQAATPLARAAISAAGLPSDAMDAAQLQSGDFATAG
jgi:hypothetical protein